MAGKRGDDSDYDAAQNGAGCYALAIRTIRLAGIRAGRFVPLPDDPEEQEAARCASASR